MLDVLAEFCHPLTPRCFNNGPFTTTPGRVHPSTLLKFSRLIDPWIPRGYDGLSLLPQLT